jgi:hypothetical protein
VIVVSLGLILHDDDDDEKEEDKREREGNSRQFFFMCNFVYEGCMLKILKCD